MKTPADPAMPDRPDVVGRVGWHHMLLDLPASWEVIGYTTEERDGQIVFGDREGECMRIFWKVISDEAALPHRLARVVAEHAGKTLTERQIRERMTAVGGWLAFIGEVGAARALACRFEPQSRALLYAIFPRHPARRDSVFIQRILESFRSNEGPERVWALFNVDITLPAEFHPIRVDPYPAAQVIRFENRRGESVTAHRYGMLSLRLENADMATFFGRTQSRRRLFYREGEFQQGGRHPGIRLSYRTRGRGGIEGFASRRWEGRVWVWRCDAIERLYAVDQNARASNLIPDLPERVQCR